MCNMQQEARKLQQKLQQEARKLAWAGTHHDDFEEPSYFGLAYVTWHAFQGIKEDLLWEWQAISPQELRTLKYCA